MSEAVIKLDNIVKSYGKHDVLKGVTMQVNKGDIYGLRWMTYKMTAVTEDTDLWN